MIDSLESLEVGDEVVVSQRLRLNYIDVDGDYVFKELDELYYCGSDLGSPTVLKSECEGFLGQAELVVREFVPGDIVTMKDSAVTNPPSRHSYLVLGPRSYFSFSAERVFTDTTISFTSDIWKRVGHFEGVGTPSE